MSFKTDAIRGLTNLMKRKAGVNDSLVCTVDSYDATTKTCYCIPVADYADIQQVKICPAEGTGTVMFPKVGSKVLVSFLSDSSAYVAMTSEVDAIWLAGDQFGGLVSVVDLVARLNTVENKLNDILGAFVAWVVAPGDGGAALKALMIAPPVATTITPTVRANIENPIVKHGNGST